MGDIEEVDKETFDRVWKIAEEIARQERHFNDLQARYRNMTSAWLLSTFAAIGFVVSKTISIGIDQELLISGIAGAGCVGILLLWVVDLLVYHRLLDACFVEGIILEQKYPWLPPIHHNMMNTQKGEGVLFRIVAFYLGPIALLIFVSGISFSLWIAVHHRVFGVVCSILTVALIIFVGQIIRSKTGNTSAIQKRLAEYRQTAK